MQKLLWIIGFHGATEKGLVLHVSPATSSCTPCPPQRKMTTGLTRLCHCLSGAPRLISKLKILSLQVHVSALSYISLGKELSVDEKVDFAHSVVGPAMYQFSSGSYYSESEYSLQGNEWGERARDSGDGN